MNTAAADKGTTALAAVTRALAGAPIWTVTGPTTIAVRAGVTINLGADAGFSFAGDEPITIAAPLVAGRDYYIVSEDAGLRAIAAEGADLDGVLGGFHFAPGGNAPARSGGDTTPAINPFSLWDIGFRPACADPRGMALVAGVRGSESLPPFWADIYLLGAGHKDHGTSAFGQTIADGDSLDLLDFAAAVAIYAQHGKQLLSIAEFAAAAYGVTELTARGRDPDVTGLDAPRTSACGLMQATGNMSTWGLAADPDTPRAALLGGVWGSGDWAGSRYAGVPHWPGDSYDWISARGRSDHLQLG